MAKQYFDLNSLKFLLYQVHNLEEVLQTPLHQDHDKESIELLLSSVKDFSDKDLFPYFREMDEDPARFEDGKIKTHPQVGVTFKKAGELGLISDLFKYEDGGLQLPMMVHSASHMITDAANNHLPGYWGLSSGAAELIVEFGNEALKETYVPNMLSGDWGGTMCLTEPQAGSSLSDITTSADPQEDGSYNIKGQKIFISAGDHEHVDNIIHLVLARIKGAPAGTKGISLFVVPKKRIKDDGSLEGNDLITAGDFQKMGQRGYATTHLIFGENDDCKGWLVGEAHQGLKYMFLMMNGARIGVGRGGAAIAVAAYHASLEYAQERKQGRRLTNTGKKDVQQEPTMIINHPDVRRMLMLQKAVAEGSLSLVMLTSRYYDLYVNSQNEADKEKFYLLLELMTPLCKTYPAEMGKVAVDNGLQVLGGYGFCSDYILQQYYRDIRIFSIYEGTTGIQSQDLLGRKLTMKGGKALMLLAQEMMETIKDAGTFDELRTSANELGEKMKLTNDVIAFLSEYAKQGDFERYISDASIFMEFFSKVVVGWLWLDMAVHAKRALVSGDKTYTEEFLESKIHTMKFYFKYELSRTSALGQILMDEQTLTIPREQEIFV